ncbi:MAG: nucleoside hydrolase [Novosphingobium sp.]
MIDRRELLAMACAGVAAGLQPAAAGAKPDRTIPQKPSARVIVDNDFAGDPDGLVALAHQLLSPKTRTVLITSSALAPQFAEGEAKTRSAALGRDVALELMDRARFKDRPPVVAGTDQIGNHQPGAAARAIVIEAMRDDRLPLYFTCGGPLTNLAAALALEPAIAKRMTVVWIGGGTWPHGGWEYNLACDGDAARKVIEQSAVPLWQVPQNAYRQMQYSVAAMRTELRSISPFGAWLYDRFTTPPSFVDVGGTWPLGDSPLALLTAISSESSESVEREARRILPDFRYGEPVPDRKITVFEKLDARLTFDDFFALMRLHARGDI